MKKAPEPRFRRSGAILLWWAILGLNQDRLGLWPNPRHCADLHEYAVELRLWETVAPRHVESNGIEQESSTIS